MEAIQSAYENLVVVLFEAVSATLDSDFVLSSAHLGDIECANQELQRSCDALLQELVQSQEQMRLLHSAGVVQDVKALESGVAGLNEALMKEIEGKHAQLQAFKKDIVDRPIQ